MQFLILIKRCIFSWAFKRTKRKSFSRRGKIFSLQRKWESISFIEFNSKCSLLPRLRYDVETSRARSNIIIVPIVQCFCRRRIIVFLSNAIFGEMRNRNPTDENDIELDCGKMGIKARFHFCIAQRLTASRGDKFAAHCRACDINSTANVGPKILMNSLWGF